MDEKKKILIIEDEKSISDIIKFNLVKEGFDVEAAYDGREGLQKALTAGPDLILLDVMLPKIDGIEVCQRIREKSFVPIIMLTAKGDDMDKIMGFEYGADDYMTKPFNILELKARIRAMLRRAGAGGEKKSAANNKLTIGTISLDLDARNAYKNGELADLTAKEFDVIEFLMRNPNHVYSREALLDTIWAYEYRSDIRTVDVHIRRLREKLEANPAEPKYIMTKWGVGYYFRK